MLSNIDRSTSFVAATALAVGALGAAYYYKSSAVAKTEEELAAKAIYETWKAGRWFVSPEDVKGTAKVTELRIYPLKVNPTSPYPAALY
jgi:hypothetical protein